MSQVIFKIIIICIFNNEVLGYVGTHHLPSIVTKNSHILVACDNMYTMESKDELIFVDFFHPIPLIVYN